METKKILLKLRTERGMSQDELADKIMVTRQRCYIKTENPSQYNRCPQSV